MTKLKTLKDFDFHNYGSGCGDWSDGIAIEKDLKQAVIDWIKSWQQQQFNIKDMEAYMMKQSKIKWVKHFFNITDEDIMKG